LKGYKDAEDTPTRERGDNMTDKQKQFINEYLIDLNATRAYKATYKNIKNNETARANSSRLLANANVRAYLDERLKAREKRTEITQDRVLNELAKIAFADMKDYLEYRTDKTVISYDDNGEPIIDYTKIVDLIDSRYTDTSVIQEISISKDGVFRFKLYDKQKALVDIGKHLGIFADKLEHSGNIEMNNPFKGLTTDELRQIIGDMD
jgi:phage terminase small subunit